MPDTILDMLRRSAQRVRRQDQTLDEKGGEGSTGVNRAMDVAKFVLAPATAIGRLGAHGLRIATTEPDPPPPVPVTPVRVDNEGRPISARQDFDFYDELAARAPTVERDPRAEQAAAAIEALKGKIKASLGQGRLSSIAEGAKDLPVVRAVTEPTQAYLDSKREAYEASQPTIELDEEDLQNAAKRKALRSGN